MHDEVKIQVLQSCKSLGFEAETEYRGKDWRADVFVLANGHKYAIEIQTSKQSLNRTLERQEKYKRDVVVGCWLFESEPSKQTEEREDLPLFSMSDVDGKTIVSIKGRKELPLEVFVSDFLQNKIKFCNSLRMHEAEVRFVEEKCWKCGFDYHIYYINNFNTPCNTSILANETLWVSDKLIFKPEIVAKVNDYVNTAKEKILNIGTIKERYSKTTQNSYASFGCPQCDAIFGDLFLHEAIIEAWYGGGVVDKLIIKEDFKQALGQNIPHWCHPGEHKFCDEA
ncbi:MAG: hypothetical protein KA120_00490 [Candidatus Goldbacteria bacterium]|nr:hypothetical protein [Candidatus Goldiibacteriota bacterium]